MVGSVAAGTSLTAPSQTNSTRDTSIGCVLCLEEWWTIAQAFEPYFSMRRICTILLLAFMTAFLGMPVDPLAHAPLAETPNPMLSLGAATASAGSDCCTQVGKGAAPAACDVSANSAVSCDLLSLCGTCSACNACNHVGAFGHAGSTAGAQLAKHPPPHLARSFRSADSTPSFKPPIS